MGSGVAQVPAISYAIINIIEALKLAHHRISPGSQQKIKEPMV